MIVVFQHPDTGITCTAEWDQEGKTLQFDLMSYENAAKHYSPEIVEETRIWCMRNPINC